MARTLSAYSQARIAEDGTRPIYAVELGFDTGGGTPMRATSLDQAITINGVSFLSTGIKVSGFDHNSTNVNPSVTINNSDGAILALIVAEGLGSQNAIIYKMWAELPATTAFATADAEIIFTGIISGAPKIGKEITLSLKHDFQNRLAPFIRLGKPVNNWNAQVGTVIRWANSKVTVV